MAQDFCLVYAIHHKVPGRITYRYCGNNSDMCGCYFYMSSVIITCFILMHQLVHLGICVWLNYSIVTTCSCTPSHSVSKGRQHPIKVGALGNLKPHILQ